MPGAAVGCVNELVSEEQLRMRIVVGSRHEILGWDNLEVEEEIED